MALSNKTFFFLFSLFHLHFLFSKSQTTELNNACSSTKTFTPNSSFQSNLATLFSTLSSANTDFFNATVASGAHGDTAYGLFMCRGDVTLQVCHQCVGTAIQRLPSVCGSSKEAIIWYDECMLRYSNRSFSATVDTSPNAGFFLWNTGNVSGEANFTSVKFTTLNETADEAAGVGKHDDMGEIKKKFATKEVNISGFHQTLYCLAQCTPDISWEGCRKCLGGAIGGISLCCDGMAGGRVLYPSCNVRYEVFRFYRLVDQIVGAPPATLPTPPAMSSNPRVKGKGKSAPIIVIVVVCLVATGITFCFAYYLLKKYMRSRRAVLRQKYFGNEGSSLEPLEFTLATIESATNKFSEENRLGKGGFGQVYKGIFSSGQIVAVKRLSEDSGQGAEEFKNEVLLIARLQHRNLVTLLGFCIEQKEKVLVYEYISNRSLDYFLFGSNRSKVLNWLDRCKIIRGISQGILYLHEHSRLKIIHRDLKPSNILLDNEMNPKISDFGLAKMVAITENEGTTRRIAGTYGYMPPEYAMFGHYSEKSDVFSFGVIILEIISGRKNTNCHEQSQDSYSLISYVWNLWRDEKLLEILDPNLKEFGSHSDVIKSIHIGLLCVQKNPDLRPSMAKVVHYLTSDSTQFPFPQEPAFILRGQMEQSTSGSGSNESCSTNEMSASTFFPR